MISLFIPLGTSSCCVYVDLSGSDQTGCGIRSQPCRSLFYAINSVSRTNDNICLIASPIKPIRYSVGKPIVIKHSLTVTKSPLFSLNPVINYRINVTNNWKEFYTFTSFRSEDDDEMLNLKIKSVDFNVNIFTSLSERKRLPLSLSITDSIISSPNNAIHLTDLSGYGNVSIHVKDSFIQSGRFILKNKRDSCKFLEHVRNLVEISNVTITNKRIVALNVNGCFNVTINKLKCGNIRWRIKELFTFKRSSLKLKNILIENVLPDNNKLQANALFLINSCAMDIQNLVVKNCKGPSNVRLQQTFPVFLVQNSLVIMRDTELIGNSIMTFMFAESKSHISIQNSVFINNHFTKAIYNIFKNSNLGTDNSSFLRNNISALLLLSSNSSAIVQKNTLTENNVFVAVYEVWKTSTIQLKDVNFTRNNLKGCLLLLSSNSSAIIQKNTLTENSVFWAVYEVWKTSTIQLKDVNFTRNNLKSCLLFLSSNCSATVKNNTIIANSIYHRVFNVNASALRIAAILLHSNIFMDYFMFAMSSSNIGLNLMRIRENIFKKDIIHIKNCIVRLGNACIENYDNYSLSAISVTCAYEGQRCFSFDFTNSKIVWNNKLLLSTRPIIELTGRIIISNVNVSVASIQEIEVMRYSTKDVEIPYPVFKVYSSTYNISSLFITCTRANVRHMSEFNTIRCIPCVQDTYTLNNGSIKMLSRRLENKKHEFQNESTDFICSDCPVGANCTEYIKSKSNFYGFKTRQQEVTFVPCPWNYCCNTNLCKKINSCNKGRAGPLCGRCSKNNTESFLSRNCIFVNSCQSFAIFWLIYCVYAFSLATCLYYLKELIVLIKTTGSKVSKVFKCFLRHKKSEGEIELVVEVVGAEEHLGKISHFTVSGIFALIVSFYQVKQVMYVDVEYKNASGFSFITFISKFINLEIIAMNSSSYCPVNNLNAVTKAFIKTYLLTIALILASLVNYFVSLVYYSFGGKLGRTSSLKPSDRLGVCFIRVLMLNYKNMTSVSLILLNCVEVAGIRVLHVNGDTRCLNWWQVIVAVFFFTWIVFFPLSLKLSYTMFLKDQISFPKFTVCLMIPFALVVSKILNRNVVSVALLKPINESYLKRILKEMFEEPYRRKRHDSTGETIFYETWRLYQRVLLAFVATFFINPLERITFMTPVIIIIAISYHVYRPYKPEMYVLHWIEIISIMGFFVCLTHNMFRGFLHVYDINYEHPVTNVLKAFDILDLLFSPILVIVRVFIIKPIYNKAKDALEAAVRRLSSK